MLADDAALPVTEGVVERDAEAEDPPDLALALDAPLPVAELCPTVATNSSASPH